MKNNTEKFNLTDELYDEIMNEYHTISYWKSKLDLEIDHANTTIQDRSKLGSLIGGLLGMLLYGSMTGILILSHVTIGSCIENWERFKPKIHALLCSGNMPNQWVEQFIAGDARLLITELIVIFISELNVGVRIAIPLVAITLKTGIYAFCSINEKENCTED
ncbi:MAG: hypothetical protein SNG38_06460 [Rikenellaceae bacterium]